MMKQPSGINKTFDDMSSDNQSDLSDDFDGIERN